MKRVALVTAREVLDGALDTDLPLLGAALEQIGIAHALVAWDDPGAAWGSFDLAVVRSTWDYVPRREQFVSWAREIPCPVRNSAEVLAWNTDKRYLRELERRGVDIVPTRWFEPGSPVDLEVLRSIEGDVVVKPAISAGAKDTATYRDVSLARAHVERILKGGRAAMLQPYVGGIEERGETALLFFEGVFSHAIHKGPLLRRGGDQADVAGLFAPERIEKRTPTDAERALADRVLSVLPFPTPLYARVDVVESGTDSSSRPLLLELELTEPSCFLDTDEGAAERFARAIGHQLA